VGLDQGCPGQACGSVPRTVRFNTDGPSTISATISNASGSVRLCLRQEPQLNGTCQTGRSASVQLFTTDSGSDTWTVSMIGKDGAPTASLTVQFNALQPSATLDSFRFSGTSNSDYNGFDVQTDALVNGSIGVQASFDDGSSGAYDWHLVIKPSGGSAVFDQTGGPAQSIDLSQNVSAGTYRVTLSDPDDVSNPGAAVFVTATISWP
jgi:hypothetical protein